MQFSLLGKKKSRSFRRLILTHCSVNYLRNIMKVLVSSFCIWKSLAKSCWHSFQSENTHLVVKKRFGPYSPIPVSYVCLLISFWETHLIGIKKKKKSKYLFQSDYLCWDLGKCLSFRPSFPKHCLSAVWRFGSAEFLPQINEGKGNISHLCGVITATTSFETNLFIASLLFKHWLIPNLLSWLNLTTSQLELAQPI